jgi:hypothetical protein
MDHPTDDLAALPLTAVLAGWRPGWYAPPWSWDDLEANILTRQCLCCGRPGHYQAALEAHIAEHGLTEGVWLRDDGTVGDGHHRIIAAKRLGIETIPLEDGDAAAARWMRDHGPVDWSQRRFGDR